ncbi:MAG: hypothetical protein ACRC5T_11120 [Cetobacterium sp.]
MPFKKGHKKLGGIKRGHVKKETIEFKQAVTNLINFATPQMVDWLTEVASEDKNKALEHIYKFAQFGFPLLARTDIQALDKNGDKSDGLAITIRHVKANEANTD